jgi:hypothetical protein
MGVFVVLIAASILMPLSALANPIPNGGHPRTPQDNSMQPDFATWQEGIAALILINLPIDILLLGSLTLVFCFALGASSMGRISRNGVLFAASIVAAGAAVAVVGGAIDFYALYSFQDVHGVYSPGWYRNDLPLYYIGFFLILASIWLSAALIPRLNILVSAVIAIIMATVSPVTWMMLEPGESVRYTVAWLAIIPVPVVVYLLYKWRSKSLSPALAKPAGRTVQGTE